MTIRVDDPNVARHYVSIHTLAFDDLEILQVISWIYKIPWDWLNPKFVVFIRVWRTVRGVAQRTPCSYIVCTSTEMDG